MWGKHVWVGGAWFTSVWNRIGMDRFIEGITVCTRKVSLLLVVFTKNSPPTTTVLTPAEVQGLWVCSLASLKRLSQRCSYVLPLVPAVQISPSKPGSLSCWQQSKAELVFVQVTFCGGQMLIQKKPNYNCNQCHSQRSCSKKKLEPSRCRDLSGEVKAWVAMK